MTHKEFVEQINNYKGTTFVSCSTETDPRMLKTNNPYLGAMKTQTLNGCIGFDYENSVNSQRNREEIAEVFDAKPRKWGTLMEGRKFVEHKGNYYLQLKVEGTKDIKYVLNGEEVIDETCTVAGKTVVKNNLSELKTFLPKRYDSRQDVDREVIIRDVKLSSIKTVRFGGNEFKLVK